MKPKLWCMYGELCYDYNVGAFAPTGSSIFEHLQSRTHDGLAQVVHLAVLEWWFVQRTFSDICKRVAFAPSCQGGIWLQVDDFFMLIHWGVESLYVVGLIESTWISGRSSCLWLLEIFAVEEQKTNERQHFDQDARIVAHPISKKVLLQGGAHVQIPEEPGQIVEPEEEEYDLQRARLSLEAVRGVCAAEQELPFLPLS